MNNNEMILGDLLDLSTLVSPKLSKTWYTMANWCYKWGKKNAEKMNKTNNNNKISSINEQQDEKNILLDILPSHATNDEKEFILSLFTTRGSKLFQSNEEFCLDQRNELYQLLNENCKSLANNSECIYSLIDTWKSIGNRVYFFHRIACKSYFTYLNLNTSNSSTSSLNQNEGNISATLRIIKILIKYAAELKEDLQKGLAKTPTQPWLLTIPQLFCRLNHPEPYVRKSVSELLCRIAREYPHLIIYPAVVGSQDGPTKIESVHHKSNKKINKNDDTTNNNKTEEDEEEEGGGTKTTESASPIDDYNDEIKEQDDESNEIVQTKEEEDEEEAINDDDDDENDSNDEEEEIVNEEKKVELKNSYKCLLDTLSETNPKMIDEVKLFVHEMRRVTLLREELWLGTLNQIRNRFFIICLIYLHAIILFYLDSDANKRMEQLTNELTKINNNTTLSESEKTQIIKEKYEIIMYPIISILEHVNEITTNTLAETPNEEKFTHEFGQKITDALKQLKNTELNAFKPYNGWSLIKQLHQILHQRSQRPKSNSLLMDQISPKLAQIKSSTIPIPDKDGHYCSLYSIMSQVLILPTKTKPKKLYFIGSNGKRYPYLFKGLEDLHLDERIMQLLSIVNTMFGKLNKSEFPNYNALHYSVTPLGPRSGLISWVENSTALFLLYKKWQQREHAYQVSKQQQQQQQGQVQQLQRPTEMFYSKLNPLLKEKSIKNFAEQRQECPISILRQVLDELIKETPNDLLSKELWCHSSTPGNWWKSIQMYSRSTAVMSVIGYVIGLGDRHLDNILVNLTSGQVAHIDYNICFEKGLNLRIPERVPFRLTQNLQHALGLSGAEGVFRLTCENVLKTLKQGRETLLTLLEAFVYDPLLDWTSNDTGIIASFYGGSSNSNSTASSSSSSTSKQLDKTKQNKETKRLMEKKHTLRLYEIRLAENRTALKSNEEALMSLILKIETIFQFVIDLQQKRDYKETLIKQHEQAKIYLDECLTLHSDTNKTKAAANQHLVYSLHDRFNRYSMYSQQRDSVYLKIKDLHDSFKKISNNFNESINFIRNFQKEENEQQKLATAPYLLTIDFFQSISQLNHTLTCESLQKELDQFKLEQANILTQINRIILSKSRIFKWLPGDYSTKFQFKQCIEWLVKIKESFELTTKTNNTKIIETIHSIYTLYRSKFNKSFKLKTLKSNPTERKQQQDEQEQQLKLN